MTSIEPIDLSDTSHLDTWFMRFSLYVITNKKITDENKNAFYLTMIGKEAFNLLVDLVYPADVTKQTIEVLHAALKAHLQTSNFEATERAKFHNIVRKP